MFVISIQSQVVYGHVGNSAAVYPMQAEGVTVAAIPTTLLSNHPRYPTMRGRVLDAELVADLLLGVEERGLIEQAAVLVTGYLGSAAIAAAVADFAERALGRNPKLVYLCDPVMGDDDFGVFVADGMMEVFRERLVPIASLATPNQFELELLTNTEARDASSLLAACRAMAAWGPAGIVVTGCTLPDTPSGEVETIFCSDEQLLRIATPKLPIRPCGTGDLLTGLIAAHLAKGKDVEIAVRLAVDHIFGVLKRTQEAKSQEMCLLPLAQ
jgi:pyridoxine kinase